jgi:uncharacterized protein (TIGR02302 family)
MRRGRHIEDPRRLPGFRARVVLARLALAWERAWPALWPLVATLGLFLVLSLFDVWRLFPVWLHAVGLVVFAVAGLAALWSARSGATWPGADAGLARIERASRLSHRPLRSLGDTLAGGPRGTTDSGLWRAHQQRLRNQLRNLRTGPPRSDLPRRDPLAVRAALILALVVALVDAGPQALDRLVTAVIPGSHAATDAIPVEISLWVTPPAYTRLPPVHRELVIARRADGEPAPQEDPLTVPHGSEALLQLHHLPETVELLSVGLGDGEFPLNAVADGSAEARLALEMSGRLSVRKGETEVGGWPVEVLPDMHPQVSFVEVPTATHRGVLKPSFEATDDYGIAGITLLLARPDSEDLPERRVLVQPSDLPREMRTSAYLDLTPHRWAGLPVVIRLEAEDAAGQTGLSGPMEIVLPERPFTHPLAQALIAERRKLAANPNRREEVAARLNGMAQTRLAEQSGVGIQLALRAAATRLLLNRTDEAVDEVIDMLWDMALDLEDEGLSLAEQELRELQEALERALAEGADDAEIERLLAELERAMEAFLDALMQQAMEAMQNQDPQATEPFVPPPGQMIDRQDLSRMMEQLRELLRSGARDAAQQMLAQLRELLENLQAMANMQQQPGQQALSELQELIQRQQGLLDETFQMGQQGQQGQQGQGGEQGQEGMRGQGADPGAMGRAAGEQEALRRALGELMQGLGEMGMPIPRAMGQAELEMRSARDALGEGAPGQAVGPQAQAVDLLRQGGQALMEQMQQQMGTGQGDMQQQFGQGRFNRDPLGRSQFNDGGADMFGDYVPDDLDLGRARAILEELYRRAGERSRPVEELDYIDRLLKRF